MNRPYNITAKTMGWRAAQLITELNAQRRSTFTLADVERITGLIQVSARSLVSKARRRGLVTRLKPGLYSLVPFELGHATEYIGDPYLLVEDLVADQTHYLAYATAFELHRMVTQPTFTIYVSCLRPPRRQTVGGYSYRFVRTTPQQIFGLTKLWITKEKSVTISDMERTIIDGLRYPLYANGVSEVAKGLWIKRTDLSVTTLVEYAMRLNVGAVIRRLGYLLELFELADAATLGQLRQPLTATYQRLDPVFPAGGPHLSRWKLQLNVAPEELLAVRST